METYFSIQSPLKSAPVANFYNFATNSGYSFVFCTCKQNLKVLQTIVNRFTVYYQTWMTPLSAPVHRLFPYDIPNF